MNNITMKKAIYFFDVLQHKKQKLSTVLLFVIGLAGLQAQNTVPA